MKSKILIWVMAGVMLLCLCIGVGSASGFTAPKIAYEGHPISNGQLFVMNEDGSSQTQLMSSPYDDQHPSFSPSLTKIAFRSNRDGSLTNTDIYVLDLTTNAVTTVTTTGFSNDYPVWSPDGTKIAYMKLLAGVFDIYKCNPDGSGEVALTNDAASDTMPSWSPDGSKIAFVSSNRGGDTDEEIYVMNADGTGVTQLTFNTAVDRDPSWSPDGTKLVFASNRGGSSQIFVMNADGSGQTPLTSNSVENYAPSWSPDGTKIAFTSDFTGSFEIFVINADGSPGFTQLTSDMEMDFSPSWSPNVIADFSATNTNGPAPLTVTFADNSLNNLVGARAWFFGDEDYSGGWSSSVASWSDRAGHCTVVLPNGSIVLTGGSSTGTDWNDVWRSADGGSTWTQVLANAPWHERNHHTSVALPDGSILVMGGGHGPIGITRLNDVWRSTDEGATWTQLANAPWSERQELTSVVLPDGSVVIIGGVDNSPSPSWTNDTWRSVDGGSTWVRMTANAEWTARFGFSTNVLPDGSIVMIGGYGGADPLDYHYLNDVWRSTDNGASWQQVTGNAAFSPRGRHSTVVMPDGTIVLMGGYNDVSGGTYMTDVWFSKDKGATWTEANVDAWAGIGREASESVVLPDGRIVATGGISEVNFLNDVWVLNPAGSSLQNPSHSYTTEGTYTVAMQAYNTGGYNSLMKSGYITVTTPTPPVAQFTADRTSGPAPLNVQFTDQSTSLPTSWLWDFGDGSTSTVQSPFHTYYAPGMYTVSLTATNVLGSDTITKLNYIDIAAPTVLAAEFTYDASSGVGPVQFTDRSSGSPTSWSWDFNNDGFVDSHLQNPAYTFAAGTYPVTLTVTNSGSSSVTKDVTVVGITKSDAKAAGETQYPSTPFVINHISKDPVGVQQLVFSSGEPPIPVPKPVFVIARYPYHRNGDGKTDLYGVSSDGSIEFLGESQSLPQNVVIEAEDPYGMTEAAYGGSNGVVSAETQQTNGGLGPLNLLAKVPKGSQTHNYALLIDGGKSAGDNHIRYWNDISFMYQTLTKVYGYPKTNIIVLMANKGTTADRHYATVSNTVYTDNSPLDLDGDNSPETVGVASYSNLISTLGTLNSSYGSSDNHLFIFTTGHGGPKSGGTSDDVIYYLWNQETITDADFVNNLPDKFGDITLVMEQCNGGGFIDNFNSRFHTGYTTQKRIIHTAASKTESSYGNAFSNVWTRGAAMINDRVQPTTEADTSSDTKVSMEEAFTFAKNTDPAATGALSPNIETPQHQNINTPGETTKFLATDGWTTANSIIVAVPNIVETWYTGFDHPILWTSRGVNYVKIELYNSTSGAYYQLVDSTGAGAGKWTWPGTDNTNRYAAAATTKYKIRITDTSASGTNDLSDQYFTIQRNGVAGGLSVNCNVSGAKIYLDGVDTGLTTVKDTDKSISASSPPGTHTIALVAPTGYLDQEKMITRTSSTSNYPVSITLAPIDSNAGYVDDDAGSMTITATPPEAHIYIDGVDKGTTLFKQEVIPGVDWKAYPHTYHVEVKAAAYLTASADVEVGRGWNVQKDFVLNGDPAWNKFTGFDAPVDMSTDSNLILNTAKAGSNIPIKWHLSDGNGYVSTQTFSLKIDTLKSCPGTTTDEIEVLDTSSPVSTLTYQGSGAWHYNWKTEKGTTGCKKVYLEFGNGLTSPAAIFRFR
jgi:PKD repeat protein